MPHVRAIVAGVLILLLGVLLGTVIPAVGFLSVPVSGIVAGYLAGGGIKRGATHGLLIGGVLSAILVAVFLVNYVGTVVSTPPGDSGGEVIGLFYITFVVISCGVVTSGVALFGGVGGWLAKNDGSDGRS